MNSGQQPLGRQPDVSDRRHFSEIGRFVQTKSVMGRLRDDHFRHLGHPPKLCMVQDASSGNNSSFWYHVRVNLMKHHKTKLNIKFFPKCDLTKKMPGSLQTVVRSGDTPKPPFPIKTDGKLENSGNQDPINHRYS